MRLLRRCARPAVAIGLCVLQLCLMALTVGFSRAGHLTSDSALGWVISAIVFGLVGAVVAARRPDNVIGWLLLGVGLFFSFSTAGGAYAVFDYRVHHGTFPLGPLALLLGPSWSPAILCGAVGIMIFPDGRPPGRASRRAMSVMLVLGALWFVGAYGIVISVIAEHTVRLTPSGDLYQIANPSGAWAWWGVVQSAFFVSVVVAWFIWLAQALRRYRHLTGEARAQQKWLFAGAGATVVLGPIAFVFSNFNSGWEVTASAVGGLTLSALPISIAIGILKFHLYDIDRVVSRSISYLLLTALVAGSYLGLVALGTRVLPFSSRVAVAATTLLLVVVFNPLRRRLQHAVDRRFNRARYDADALVASFAGRLRDVVQAEAVHGELLQAIERAVEPATVLIWMKEH